MPAACRPELQGTRWQGHQAHLLLLAQALADPLQQAWLQRLLLLLAQDPPVPTAETRHARGCQACCLRHALCPCLPLLLLRRPRCLRCWCWLSQCHLCCLPCRCACCCPAHQQPRHRHQMGA
jgi:hypothetical protein